jgi:UDP-glucose:(heptosyl)LPS alpha-1,3-glucosyltransferase
MRAALVHMRHAEIGGTELILDRLADHLARLGHDVTIVCRSHARPPHPAVRFERLHPFAIGSAWRTWAFARDVERHARSAGYDVVLALGKTWTHDVIRTGGGSHATLLQRARQFGGRRETVRDRLAVRIERRAYAPGAYRKVIANSRMVARDMTARYGIPAEAIEVIYNGVDLERFHPRARERAADVRRALGLAPGHFVCSFVGSGFRRKGLERLLRAFPELAAARPESRLVVVGKDSSRARHEALARELGIDARVQFLGARRDVPALIGASDLFVLPTWYDSFAFTVLEAMASGVPVVTTDSAGASELVDDGVHGAVLSGDCTGGELAHALLEWSDRDRARRAGELARARAEEHGFERTLGRIAAVLVEVAAARA